MKLDPYGGPGRGDSDPRNGLLVLGGRLFAEPAYVGRLRDRKDFHAAQEK